MNKVKPRNFTAKHAQRSGAGKHKSLSEILARPRGTTLLAEARIEHWSARNARKIEQEYGWNWRTPDSE